MVACAYAGLPMSLDKASEVLAPVIGERKDSKGKALIRYFCLPCKPTKTNGGRTRNVPSDASDKWEAFKAYCAQDVETERAIWSYLTRVAPVTKEEWHLWALDQRINDRGIAVDADFVRAAIAANTAAVDSAQSEMQDITHLPNPNSLSQLKLWLTRETRRSFDSLNAETVRDLLQDGTLPPHVQRVLQLRALASNTSCAKYDAMLAQRCNNKRIKGQFQFYGASTGRWSGKGVQLHNLKRTLPAAELDAARGAVLAGCSDMCYADVSGTVSRLTRTALVPNMGCKLIVADYSAIEARVIAWLAGEEWALEVFRGDGKIYEATAAQMFRVPVEQVTKGSDLRKKGKVATLALGYQGREGSLINMGALTSGLTEEELPDIVRRWRGANPHIVALWRKVEQAATAAVSQRKVVKLSLLHTQLVMSYERGWLFISLPSGRRLAYYAAEVKGGKLSYSGINQTTKQWCRIDTYGGKLVENIVQAIARDCLCLALLHIEAAGLPVLMHVHDEVISQARADRADKALERMCGIMSLPPHWAQELPLRGDGFISDYYKKD
jgi:DNA polymerase